MLSMNRATLVGHAGGDPEIRKLASGEDVARFSLATTERFTRRDDTVGQAFGAAAGAVRKLVRKGDPVLVEGRIATRSWKDKTGSLRRTTEIVVAGPRGQINVLSRRSQSGGDDDPAGGAAAGDQVGGEEDTVDAEPVEAAAAAGRVDAGGSKGAGRRGSAKTEEAGGGKKGGAAAAPGHDGADSAPGDGTAAGG